MNTFVFMMIVPLHVIDALNSGDERPYPPSPVVYSQGESSAVQWKCDTSNNFVPNLRSRQEVVSGTRSGVGHAYAGRRRTNDEAVAYCKSLCATGCTGFSYNPFSRLTPNDKLLRQVCGFYSEKIDLKNAENHNHLEGSQLCMKLSPPQADEVIQSCSQKEEKDISNNHEEVDVFEEIISEDFQSDKYLQEIQKEHLEIIKLSNILERKIYDLGDSMEKMIKDKKVDLEETKKILGW